MYVNKSLLCRLSTDPEECHHIATNSLYFHHLSNTEVPLCTLPVTEKEEIELSAIFPSPSRPHVPNVTNCSGLITTLRPDFIFRLFLAGILKVCLSLQIKYKDFSEAK